MKKPKSESGDGAIYTLAQSRTTKPLIDGKVVTGNGSDLTDGITAEGRGKRKFITVQLTLSLIDVAKAKKDKKMEKKLWNSFHCQRKITESNGVIYGNYCKNRMCTVCMAIRKADIINRYYPVLSLWEQPQFVTLTIKSCYAKRLPFMMDKMIRAFQLIIDRTRKRYERGNGLKLIGIRSLECNFNPIERTYNPHFHVIVPNKEMADLLKREWLAQWPRKYAQHWCQKIIPVYDIKLNLIEVIKYGSKIFTEPEMKKKAKGQKGNPKIYARALYNILKAMNNRRLFDRFGFNVSTATIEPTGAKVITDFQEMIYIPKLHDWINKGTMERLTNFAPPADILDLLRNRVDSEKQ